MTGQSPAPNATGVSAATTVTATFSESVQAGTIAQHSTAQPVRPSLLERRGGSVLVVLLLTIGALVVPVIGWFVGLVLLWRSSG